MGGASWGGYGWGYGIIDGDEGFWMEIRDSGCGIMDGDPGFWMGMRDSRPRFGILDAGCVRAGLYEPPRIPLPRILHPSAPVP